MGLIHPRDMLQEDAHQVRQNVGRMHPRRSRLVASEEKMGEDDDQALTTHAKKDKSERDNHPHKRPKRFQKNQRSKHDFSSLKCYICDEKGHFAKDCPRNKGSTRTNKKRYHAHIVEEDELEKKRIREDS